MSKRNMPAPSSPDVTYDTDEDGTKVIIRKFDMPLPTKQGKITVSEKKMEKWKYQHDVPEGKIFTKRVHADVSPITSTLNGDNLTSNIPGYSSYYSPSSSVSKVLPTNVQNIQLVASAPTSKDNIVLPPKEQSSKACIQSVLLSPAPKTICSDKITLNNLPENVLANSITLFDSKFVNGRKVLYLKAVKDVAKVIGNSVKGGTEVILTQNEIITQGTTSAATPVINPVPVKPKELRCYYPSRIARKTIEKNDSGPGGKVSVSQPPPVIPQKMKFTSREVPVGNILENMPVLCDDCDIGSKKCEVQINKPMPVSVPSTVQHPNLHSLPLSTLNKEVMPCTVLTAETVPRIRSGTLSGAVHEAANNGREITLQINPLKTNSHILIEASKPKLNLTEGNVSVVGVEFLNSVANNTSSRENGLSFDDQPVIKEGKLQFVPADSTTPTIVNVCSTSVHQNADHTKTESRLIVNQETLDKECMNGAVPGNRTHSSSCIDSKNISKNECNNSVQNIVIVNPSQNSSSNVAAIPKPNIDEIMRRRKIALKFQQDMQRAKEMPRIERTVVMPARKVNIVDSSTQTSLFCMLEPGRMVEMFLNDDSNDSNIINQSGSQDTRIGMKEHSQSVNERNPTFISNSQTAINDQMNPPLSKRIRLDNTDTASGTMEGRNFSCNRGMNNDPLLTSSMDFEDLIQPFESLGKENIESTNVGMQSKNYKTYENNIQNNNHNNNFNNYSTPLSCMQSTLNSNVNCIEENVIKKFIQSKENMEALHRNYRDCLIPDEDGNLPLHNAVMDRDVRQVQRQCLVLGARKQSVDIKNKMKETALHLAVLCHDFQIVKVLLKFKAKPNISDGEGNTPVHMAIIWGNNVEILQALLASTEYNSPALNAPNDEGFSPLHLCALHNKPSEALLLVKKNVDVNIRDRKSGRTPLFHAVENGNSELSQVLLNAGAHTNIPNFSGQTALNASELTLVLDQLCKNGDSSRGLKPQAIQCVCQDETNENRSSNKSLNKKIVVFERTDIDDLNSNNDIRNINLLDVYHNR